MTKIQADRMKAAICMEDCSKIKYGTKIQDHE
jgi:hypothetical protein